MSIHFRCSLYLKSIPVDVVIGQTQPKGQCLKKHKRKYTVCFPETTSSTFSPSFHDNVYCTCVCVLICDPWSLCQISSANVAVIQSLAPRSSMPIFINAFMFISLECHFITADLKCELTVRSRVRLTRITHTGTTTKKTYLFLFLSHVSTYQKEKCSKGKSLFFSWDIINLSDN